MTMSVNVMCNEVTCCTGALLAKAGESWQGDGSPLQQLSSGIQVPDWPVLDNEEIRVIVVCTEYLSQEAKHLQAEITSCVIVRISQSCPNLAETAVAFSSPLLSPLQIVLAIRCDTKSDV